MAGAPSTLRQPLDLQSRKRPLGQVFIIPDRCKGCNFCVDFCPQEVLVLSEEMNVKGYHYAVVAPGKDAECVNCDFCRIVCPEFAIYTEEVTVGV